MEKCLQHSYAGAGHRGMTRPVTRMRWRTLRKGDGQKIGSVVFRKYPRQCLRIQDIGMHGIDGGGCLCVVDKATICFRSQRAMNPIFLEPLRSQSVPGNFRQQAGDMWTSEGAEPHLGLRRVIRIAHIKVRVSEQPEQSHEICLEQEIHVDESADTPTVVQVPQLSIGDVRTERTLPVLHRQPRAGVRHIVEPCCVSRIELCHWERPKVYGL